jgi:hypothetical protein
VGGTKIAAGVLDRDLNLLVVCITKEHAGQLPVQVVDVVAKMYWAALSEAHVSSSELSKAGLSFPGHTHGRKGIAALAEKIIRSGICRLADLPQKEYPS